MIDPRAEEHERKYRPDAEAGDPAAMAELSRSLRTKQPIEAEWWGWHAAAVHRGRIAQPISDEVKELAASAQLGEHRSTFGNDDRTLTATEAVKNSIGLIIGLAMLAGPALFLVGAFAGFSYSAVGAAVIGLFVLILWISARKNVEEKVWVFEHGLVHRTPQRTSSVLLWTEIRVLRDVSRGYSRKTGKYLESKFRYTLQRQDGPELELRGDRFPSGLPTGHLCVLGEIIEREVAAARLPKATAALERGKRIDFGDLSIDATSIVTERGPLVWSDIDAIERIGETIRIRGGNWVVDTPVSIVPDAVVLVMLADALRTSNRAERGRADRSAAP